MMLPRVVALLSLASYTTAISASSHLGQRHLKERDGITYNVFEHRDTNSTISYIKNSGICETTPGVNQYSGYVETGEDMHMWFWFFESRNNPQTDPLAAWFNGGPGCSSMQSVFRANGPCGFFNGSSEPSLNEFSWNKVANMLYIDQPIGVGFSYGDNVVNSTFTAAPYVWNLFQTFLASFPEYQSRDFGIFTESYGGMYGPEFSRYVQEKNEEIDQGTATGDKIKLVALGINNGWYDEILNEQAYIDFALDNSYRQLINETYADQLQVSMETTCIPAVNNCTLLQTDSACSLAQNSCGISTAVKAVAPAFYTYDIRVNTSNVPSTFQTYLKRPEVLAAIGARHNYTQCISSGFGVTGDEARGMLPTLGKIVDTGIQVLVWAGDADFTCNWKGNFEAVQALEWEGKEEFVGTEVSPFTVGGVEKGLFKTGGNLSWLQVYEAGHQVPFFQPELSLQVFNQTIHKEIISST